jgi:hypothetical protein
MARFAAAVGLVALGLCLGAAADDGEYAYLTGVYWLDGGHYQIDITCWNIPGNPDGGLVREIKMGPGGVPGSGRAPQGWHADVTQDHVHWLTSYFDDEYMIPPGEWLSGFGLTTDYDPGEEVYWYVIWMSEGDPSMGDFTPELIPEPLLAGPVFLAGVATWEMLRRRRQ